MLRQNWADGSADWYVRRDGSAIIEDDLIDPRAAACLQIGYYSEMVVTAPSIAIKSLLAAVSCLEGRVLEEPRIELANHLQGARHRDQMNAPVICHRVSRYASQMLKEDEPMFRWFVLGQELGRCVIRRRVWKRQLKQGRGLPVQSGELQDGINVLADGWRLLPLPSVARIESYLNLWFSSDPAEIHDGEQISTLVEYWNEIWPLAAKDGSPTVYLSASGDYSPGSSPPVDKVSHGHDDDMSSFENVLRAVTEMVEPSTPNFTNIGQLVDPRLYSWSDDQVRRLLEVKRLSDTAETLRWAMAQPESRAGNSPGDLRDLVRLYNAHHQSEEKWRRQ